MSATTQSLQDYFAPSPLSNWTRRAYHASVVVGDYVYIDMGEVAIGSAPFAPNMTNPTYTPFPINCTLTLPIGQSWSDPNTVRYNVINKPAAPVYDFSTLWYDEGNQSLYSFGGEESYLDTRRVDLAVWKLQLDGKGGGTWTQNTSYEDPPFSQGVTRPFGGAATSKSDSGFYLGGYSSSHSSPATQALTSFVSTPGLIQYNFKDRTWSNTTSGITALSQSGAFEWGGLEHIPIGPNGLLAIWGGETSNSTTYFPGTEERPMDTVTLLDPVTKAWYQQTVTGNPLPSVRNRFCSFVASDSTPLNTPNHTTTAEIFMYGGYAGIFGSNAVQYDEIWVLSIPAFTWQRVDASQKSARIGHTCHLVGGRQMLSIGGADAGQTDTWNTPDYTNLNGLGIYDLVDERWTQGYNASAAPYQRGKTVQGWYDKNGPYPKQWTQPSLADLILHNKTTTPTTSSPSSAPTNLAPPSSSSSTPAPPPHHTPNTATTALIAGTTLGITFGLLIPFLFVFWYLRQKAAAAARKGSEVELYAGKEREKFELGAGGRESGRGSRARGQRVLVELEGAQWVEELGGGRTPRVGTPGGRRTPGGRSETGSGQRGWYGGRESGGRSQGSRGGSATPDYGGSKLDEWGLEKSGRDLFE